MNKIILVIPTFNEALNVNQLINGVAVVRSSELEVLMVDDASPDGTATIIQSWQTHYPWLHLLTRKIKLGLGEAYRAGFRWSLTNGADAVGEMDADLSHQPEDLPKMFKAINDGADVVIGSRRIAGGKIVGWSWWRRFTSWAAMIAARKILKLKTKDVTSGFRLYTRRALTKIPWEQVKSSGYAWQEELIFLAEQAKLKCVEVPITFIDRQHGQSKLSMTDIWEFFVTLWRLNHS